MSRQKMRMAVKMTVATNQNKQIHKTDRKVYLLYTMGSPKDEYYLMNAAESEDGPKFSFKKKTKHSFLFKSPVGSLTAL